MKSTIEALIDGDSQVTDYYQQAKQQWDEILQAPDAFDTPILAERLSYEQRWFERNCGGLEMGQEIMVVVGIGQFYSTKFLFEDHQGSSQNEEDARAVVKAFASSRCSIEVKSVASRVAEFYGLPQE